MYGKYLAITISENNTTTKETRPKDIHVQQNTKFKNCKTYFLPIDLNASSRLQKELVKKFLCS